MRGGVSPREGGDGWRGVAGVGSDSTIDVTVEVSPSAPQRSYAVNGRGQEPSPPQTRLSSPQRMRLEVPRSWAGGMADGGTQSHSPLLRGGPELSLDASSGESTRGTRFGQRHHNPSGGRGDSQSRDRIKEIWKERRRLLAEFHNRPRQKINYPLRLLHATVMSEGHPFTQGVFHFRLLLPWMENPSQKYHAESRPTSDMHMSPFTGYSSESVERPRATAREEFRHSAKSNLRRLLYRFFCIQCSVAQLTTMLFFSRERQHLVQQRLCCDGLFGDPSRYARSLGTIICCDILTAGFPCCGCLGYRGCGTALYGWRVRYMIRCRYGVQGTSIGDFITMLFCPLLGADQMASELELNGVHEYYSASPPLSYYVIQ